MKRLIYLAKRYDAVVGDNLQLFYRGLIKSLNPYKYYIHIECDKGRAYPRYYSYTPTKSEVGDHEFTLTLYNDYHEEIESAKTIIHVVKPVKPLNNKNILCFGDSLTVNGVWPYEAYRRFCLSGGCPEGLNMGKCLNFIGNSHKEEVGYVGFGGWKWLEFCMKDSVGMTSSVWVTCKHHLDEHDQESYWTTNDKSWILETIEENRLKFKHGPGNFWNSKNIGEKFTHVEGGLHHEDIIVESFVYEQPSPFFIGDSDKPSFKKFAAQYGVEQLDYIYVLLTWNGQYVPYAEEFSMHDKYIKMLLNIIHEEFPNCKVGVIGIQSPAINGGIAANYGAHGVYSDLFGDITTAYNYDMYLESLCLSDEYRSYCRYIDMKAQFDVENSTPSVLTKVNNRSEKMELIGTNGVHPTMEGYLQIGDCFYRALVSDLAEE